ncbi:MAG: hypothetical protein WDN45_14610 [Caulobacteraceae bacterium]
MTTQAAKRPHLVLGFDAQDRKSLLTMALGAAVIIPVAASCSAASTRRRPKACG